MAQLNETDGLCDQETSLEVKINLYNMFIRSKLLYGTDNMYISEKVYNEIKSLEGNILKGIIGITKKNYTTRLFNAMSIKETKEMYM